MNAKHYALAALLLSAIPASALAADAGTYATLHASEPAIPAGDGRIYFYREGGLLGAAIQPTIMIDGVSAGGRAKPGDYFHIDRPPGTYKISTETEKEESTSVTVVEGQAVYVKFEISMGFFVGHVSPSVVDAQKAEAEIKDCDWHEPKPVATTPPATPGAAPSAPVATSSAPATPAIAPPGDTTTTTPSAPATPLAPPAPSPAPAAPSKSP